VLVAPPRVAESPVALECRWFKTVDLPDSSGEVANQLVIGRVVGVHIDDRYIADGRVNTAAMRPIARLGYSEYAVVESAFRMRRPD
jgi:flavin reductase (DIM6/NTAB) family NADH-FMN oxidoreductase RutF